MNSKAGQYSFIAMVGMLTYAQMIAAQVGAAVRYVDINNPSPVPPYTTWATAATNIQDAIDTALPGDDIVVTNGVYQTGGRAVYGTMTNRVVVDKRVTVRSLNGREVTTIRGYQVPGATNGDGAVRCVYLTNGAELVGFTLTDGATHTNGDTFEERYGGGVWCDSTSAVVTDCVLTGNSAEYGGGGAYGATLNNCMLSGNFGGGASFGTLNNCTLRGNSGSGASACTLSNCTLTGNSAIGWGFGWGGGAIESTLNGCTLVGNSAESGGGAFRSDLNNCILIGNWASGWGGGAMFGTLNHCTLASNSAAYGGGGAAASLLGGVCILSNCTLIGNSANSGGAVARQCRLYNCLLNGNLATYGGGISSDRFGIPALNNCTVTGNSAEYGGGVYAPAPYGATLNNCIVYFNTAPNGANQFEQGTLRNNYTCTTPLPTNGVGNFTNAPLFVDQTNMRLQSNSPCINAGRNADAPVGPELDGNPRIVGGTVDVGAYEFQAPGSIISYAWLQGYGLPTDGSADFADSDSDGLNNSQEWRCRTDPTNALSVLRLLSVSRTGADLTVRWKSVAGVRYSLERSTNLALLPQFTPLATNLLGESVITSFTDTNSAGEPRLFYRVASEPP